MSLPHAKYYKKIRVTTKYGINIAYPSQNVENMSRPWQAAPFGLAPEANCVKLAGMEHQFTLQAGAAFGDGGHPSTALALWMLAALPPDFPHGAILDVGCGSGILSLAAALKWDAPVLACDIDLRAVEQTRTNAQDNGLAHRIQAVRADGTQHPHIAAGAPYGLLLSNILTDLHIRHARDFARLLSPQGRLLLAGILVWRIPELLAYYAALGYMPEQEERSGDWAALLLRPTETP